MLVLNKEGTAGTVVDQSNTAKTMGSGSLEVYATPALCALMEKAGQATQRNSTDLTVPNRTVHCLPVTVL